MPRIPGIHPAVIYEWEYSVNKFCSCVNKVKLLKAIFFKNIDLFTETYYLPQAAPILQDYSAS